MSFKSIKDVFIYAKSVLQADLLCDGKDVKAYLASIDKIEDALKEIGKSFPGSTKFGPEHFSEYRKNGMRVQVCGVGNSRLDCSFYGRYIFCEYDGWTKWVKIGDIEFNHIDKQARREIGDSHGVSSIYAKYYFDLID